MKYNSCLHPLHITNRYTHEEMDVPCGKCVYCRSVYANMWSTRCDLESSCHRYTLFLTLTYTDNHLPVKNISDFSDVFVSKTWDKSLSDSSAYIALKDGVIPCVSVDDIQKFFKRLRINLFRKYGIPEKERSIRYFCAAEYGPTTFRPHYHMLLWYDSPKIHQYIKECIFAAWSCKNSAKNKTEFFKRNRCELVRCSASKYVAGYLNSTSNIPPLLQEKPFRCFSLKSSRPAIGALVFQPSQIQALFFGNALRLSYVRPATHEVVNLPLWSSFENRYFPKVRGFYTLSPSNRIALYGCSSVPYGESTTCKQFIEWLRSEWLATGPLVELLRKTVCEDDVNPESGIYELSEDKAKRLYYTSRLVRNQRRILGLSLKDYVYTIESYWSRKEYAALVSQLEFQEELSNSSYISFSYYPCLIDSSFYENKNQISSSVYSSYLRQFNIDDVTELALYTPDKCPLYHECESLFSSIYRSNQKSRRKKEFVASHPEFYSIYKQLLIS